MPVVTIEAHTKKTEPEGQENTQADWDAKVVAADTIVIMAHRG